MFSDKSVHLSASRLLCLEKRRFKGRLSYWTIEHSQSVNLVFLHFKHLKEPYFQLHTVHIYFIQVECSEVTTCYWFTISKEKINNVNKFGKGCYRAKAYIIWNDSFQHYTELGSTSNTMVWTQENVRARRREGKAKTNTKHAVSVMDTTEFGEVHKRLTLRNDPHKSRCCFLLKSGCKGESHD